MEKKIYTNVHQCGTVTQKTRLQKMTLDEARAHGEKFIRSAIGAQYLGVLNVDITQKQIDALCRS